MMNPMQMINSFRQFMANPTQFLSGMGLPQNALSDPKSAVEYLMNTGRMTQQQFNELSATAKQLQNDPQFMSMFGGK
jgi:hypothetical protein